MMMARVGLAGTHGGNSESSAGAVHHLIGLKERL